MALSIANLTNDGIYWSNAKNACVTLPDGSIIVIVPINTTQFRVYRSIGYGQPWATATTITVSAIAQTGSLKYAIEPSRDGTQILLVYRCANNNIKSRLITVSGWAVAAEQTVYSATAVPIYALDASQSEGGAWVVAGFYQNSSNAIGAVVFVRTTAGSWAQLNTYVRGSAATLSQAMVEIAVEFHTGGTAARRGLVIALSGGSTANDLGFSFIHCKIDEASGAMNDTTWQVFQSGINTVGSYVTAVSGASAVRRIRLQRTSAAGVMVVGMITPRVVPRVGSSGNTRTNRVTIARIKATQNNSANTDVQTYSSWDFAHSTLNDTAKSRRRAINFSYDEDGNPTFAAMATEEDGYVPVNVYVMNSFSGTTPTVTERKAGSWDYNIYSKNITEHFFGSKAWDGNLRRHPVIYYSRSLDTLAFSYVNVTPSVTKIRPAASEVVTSSKPDLTVTTPVPPYITNVPVFSTEWQVATDVGFTSNLQTYVSDFLPFGPFTAANPQADKTMKWIGAPIPVGSRRFRARIMNAYGTRSAWFETSSPATIQHAPIVANLNPGRGDAPTPRPYVDSAQYPGNAVFAVSGKFSDAWSEDYQTAIRATLYTESMSQVWTSGKQPASATTVAFLVPFAYRNVPLLAGIEVWDSFDTSGGFTEASYAWVVLYSPPTVDSVSLLTVDGNGFCNSNAPAFNYTTTPGIYETVRLDVTISQAGKTLGGWQVLNPVEDGSFQVPTPILKPDQNYTVTITATDENGLQSSRSFQFTTKWAPPAATTIAVSTSSYNIENQATIDVTWTDVAQDPDLIMWNIYRQVDEIDPYTQVVLKSGELELVGTIGDIATSYLFEDYSAPSAHRVGYLVRQVVDRFGSGAIMEADNQTLAWVYPKSEGYWLIDPTPEDTANQSFQLANVISDSYTDRYESSIVHLIGRGNHEDRGDDLGVEGSLTVQLRNGQGTSARQKKLRLEAIRSEARSLFLRTPFGDIWFVAVGDIQIDRLAGVGLAEFCDVTIPYTEVYE